MTGPVSNGNSGKNDGLRIAVIAVIFTAVVFAAGYQLGRRLNDTTLLSPFGEANPGVSETESKAAAEVVNEVMQRVDLEEVSDLTDAEQERVLADCVTRMGLAESRLLHTTIDAWNESPADVLNAWQDSHAEMDEIYEQLDSLAEHSDSPLVEAFAFKCFVLLETASTASDPSTTINHLTAYMHQIATANEGIREERLRWIKRMKLKGSE